jgi:hypothetical protein
VKTIGTYSLRGRRGASIAIYSNIRAPVAQLDRVTGFEPVGREFESLRAHQTLPSGSIASYLSTTPCTLVSFDKAGAAVRRNAIDQKLGGHSIAARPDSGRSQY